MFGNILGALSLPLVFAILFFLIQVLEAALGAGTGPEKKAKVIEAIMKLFEMAKWNMPPVVKDNLSVFIDWLVWLCNFVIGFFAKAPASPPK
jgi:hypothetical protein